jgi:hypothetical protein
MTVKKFGIDETGKREDFVSLAWAVFTGSKLIRSK